jgi:hypothetical protein
MLGLLALGLTVVMIYTLVKNALIGTQLSADDHYTGTLELIIPITSRSEFYLEPWIQNLTNFQSLNGHVRIHILIDGHHPAVNAWQELHQKLPYVELHSFLMRPLGREAVPWMIEQIAPKLKGEVIIIGDAELVPTEHAFMSIGKLVSSKQKAYFILPQTHKQNILGEAIASINPTLALASVFGFRRIRRNVSHPLVSIAQGWMGMPLATFQKFDWAKINIPSWKEALAKGWDLENKSYILAFGEKHLLRYYPEDVRIQALQLRTYWEELWLKVERKGLGLFLVAGCLCVFYNFLLHHSPILGAWKYLFTGFVSVFYEDRLSRILGNFVSAPDWMFHLDCYVFLVGSCGS